MLSKRSRLGLMLAAIVVMVGAVAFARPVSVKAAGKAKVVLEFSNGKKKTWKGGNAPVELGKRKLEYVYFGSYPQSEVTGEELTDAITGADYDEDDVANVDGTKYKRLNDRYFKFEPIK